MNKVLFDPKSLVRKVTQIAYYFPFPTTLHDNRATVSMLRPAGS